MKKIILLLLAAAALAALYAQASAPVKRTTITPDIAAVDTTRVSEADVKMARFFAGIALLRSVPGQNLRSQQEEFRKLETVSGVTAAAANKFLDECRKDPERFRLINNLALSILTEISENPAPVR